MPSYPVLEIAGTAEDLEIALSFLQDWGCLGEEVDDFETSLPARFRVRETWTSGERAALVLTLVALVRR